jgi:hypothetical protein
VKCWQKYSSRGRAAMCHQPELAGTPKLTGPAGALATHSLGDVAPVRLVLFPLGHLAHSCHVPVEALNCGDPDCTRIH